jgi:hypothetical protein
MTSNVSPKGGTQSNFTFTLKEVAEQEKLQSTQSLAGSGTGTLANGAKTGGRRGTQLLFDSNQ